METGCALCQKARLVLKPEAVYRKNGDSFLLSEMQGFEGEGKKEGSFPLSVLQFSYCFLLVESKCLHCLSQRVQITIHCDLAGVNNKTALNKPC